MLPTIKQYNIDYDFLISNYLNKELWKKKWNLFVYKDNVFTLNLASIDTKNNAICFEIRYNKLNTWYECATYVFDSMSIKILKQKINGAIFRLMERYDQELCRQSKGYRDICDMYSDEEETLTDIANSYLDECGVTQTDIRDAYIDIYVRNNTRCDIHKANYLSGKRYMYLTDMFIVFTKITNDTNRYETVVKSINDTGYLNKVEEEIKEFKQYFHTDEYKEEMTDNLITI